MLTIRHWLSLIFESVFPLFVSLKYQESDNKKSSYTKKRKETKETTTKKEKGNPFHQRHLSFALNPPQFYLTFPSLTRLISLDSTLLVEHSLRKVAHLFSSLILPLPYLFLHILGRVPFRFLPQPLPTPPRFPKNGLLNFTYLFPAMSQNRPGLFPTLRMGGKIYLIWISMRHTDISSLEVIREKVQDGLTGESKEISYTQCKIVGNGSFGVVFQTKMAPSGEDAAIKRVLQDKRFKVNRALGGEIYVCVSDHLFSLSRIVSCRSCGLCAIPTLSNSKPFTTPTATGYVFPGCPARSSFRPPFLWTDRGPDFSSIER